MQTTRWKAQWKTQWTRWTASIGRLDRALGAPPAGDPRRRRLLAMGALAIGAAVMGAAAAGDGGAYGGAGGRKWAATWATSIQAAYVLPTVPQGAAVSAFDPQPDLRFALPNATTSGAVNQTFRMIVKPDLWGRRMRVRFSNVFGTQPVTFSHAALALQAYQANIVPRSSVDLSFGGRAGVTIPAGQQAYSDAIELPFVPADGAHGLAGRNLAVSFAVEGASGPASYHASAFTTSYISLPDSGDRVNSADDSAFPYSTTSFFFVSEVDVLASADTQVVVAFGDSITDGTFSTLNGNDRWLNVMSRRLHDRLGDKVSVVNEGIGGNGVVATLAGQPATQRVARDVIGLAGVDTVVWLEGINDLGNARLTPATIVAGYRQVVAALHSAGIAAVGATITSSYVPNGVVPANSPLAAGTTPAVAASYGSTQTDGYRQRINNFILTGGLFDATADFSGVTIDTATGTLLPRYVPNSEGSAGDYLHPNRAGYQAMGMTAADAVLGLARTTR